MFNKKILCLQCFIYDYWLRRPIPTSPPPLNNKEEAFGYCISVTTCDGIFLVIRGFFKGGGDF